MAIIEVFIHDPLFNWCVNDVTADSKRKNTSESGRFHLIDNLHRFCYRSSLSEPISEHRAFFTSKFIFEIFNRRRHAESRK